ncbi:MAG: ABC transporter ATP-binding protein [Planctomycetota bacterium]|nr:ABC transporter ATP-binding protein [Planctomycetota bacterium]
MGKLLEARDVSFAYGEQVALRGVSLSLGAGEIVALIGPNGSGKSTLIKALLGSLRASGEIVWEGHRLNDWRRRDLGRVLAYLPQSPGHEPGQTVEEVLRLGRAPYWGAFGLEASGDDQIVREVAGMLGLGEYLDRLVDEMSGGQRQRVFVGRCLAQQPRALLLDEPNTFLDLKHQVELWGLLRDLAREKKLGVLIASHELNICAAYADRMVLLKGGVVVAVGTPGEVMNGVALGEVYGVGLERFLGKGGNVVVVPEMG